MQTESINRQQLTEEGYAILNNIFTASEVHAIIDAINNADVSGPAFRKTSDLFAIRRFIKEVPAMHSLVFNNRLLDIIHNFFGHDYFLVKSIYFDKPEQSNWRTAL